MSLAIRLNMSQIHLKLELIHSWKTQKVSSRKAKANK